MRPLPLDATELLPSIYFLRRELTRRYLSSLATDDLLFHHRFEAAGWSPPERPSGLHGGWEFPTSQVRGHFLGHWMSSAARIAVTTDDAELRGRVVQVVRELGRCQQVNGGEWIASIPEKYLELVARGTPVWASSYVVHKTLMGLWDAYALLGDTQALDVLTRAARWFTRFTDRLSPEQLDDFLDAETGGMLEIWADLYGVTGDDEHLELMQRFDRRRLFDRLIAGRDVLTNRHANNTIPEVLGAARAWEVTGEQRWRDVVEAYWRLAVTERGFFCTGGQTSGEVWTPPFELGARLGGKTQEHCTVYNMMRLANKLLCWTGDPAYADYLERNLVNGVLAQQHRDTGMVSYFLGLGPGSQKEWTTPTESFPCCQGTMVQAAAAHGAATYLETDSGLVVSLYQPSRVRWSWESVRVVLTTSTSEDLISPGVVRWEGETAHRPDHLTVEIEVRADEPTEFTLGLRLPWWLAGPPRLSVNGERVAVTEAEPSSFWPLRRRWSHDSVRLELPRALSTCPLPDRPDVVAFMDGPLALAGITDQERLLVGDPADASSLIELGDERHWNTWRDQYRLRDQGSGMSLLPLRDITDERYTVYFPVAPPAGR